MRARRVMGSRGSVAAWWVAVMIGVVLTGCGGNDEAASPPPTPTIPPSPEPVATEACPYLKAAFVQDANGQHVQRVRISADRPYPACFFYRADSRQQASVQVYRGTPLIAEQLVNQAVPPERSSRASLAGGWEGGSMVTDTGAVYAVGRQDTAVVVRINQKQTIKAKRIAEEVISNLASPVPAARVPG